MTKIFKFLLTSVLLMSLVMVSTTQSVQASTDYSQMPPTIPGDANRDNSLNHQDKQIIFEILYGQRPNDPGADLNGDGIIGPVDYSRINDIATGSLGGYEPLLRQMYPDDFDRLFGHIFGPTIDIGIDFGSSSKEQITKKSSSVKKMYQKPRVKRYRSIKTRSSHYRYYRTYR